MTKKDTAFWIAIFLVLVGVVLRWIGLEIRPLHHDESIHVMFGRYFFDWPNDNYYKYNPEYHGPLLYNLLRFVYETLGDFEWSARALIAFFGTAILLLPFALRRYLEDVSFVGLVALMSLSPTMIYWSRFVREDIFVIAGMAMMLYGVLGARPQLKSLWILIGVVFQYASKENSYVTMALFWAFFVAEWFAKRILDKKKEPLPLSFLAPIPFALVMLLHIGMERTGAAYTVVNRMYMDGAALLGGLLLLIDCLRKVWVQAENPDNSLVVKLFAHIAKYRAQFFTSFALAAGLFCYLFSAGFRYSKGIIDGLYYSGITYWLEKHHIERIKGPFLFHFYQLAWYEIVFIVLVIWQAIYFFKRSDKFIKYSALAVLILALVVGFVNKPSSAQVWTEPSFFLWKKIKAKDWFDVMGGVVLISYPILLTLGHWLKREWTLGFFAYAFSASFFTYSYLGEKVPWLSSYPLIMGWLYLAVYINNERRLGRLDSLLSQVSIAKIIGIAGWVFLGLGLVFIVEDLARFDMIYPGKVFSLKTVLNENQLLLLIGLAAIGIEYIDSKFSYFGSVQVAGCILLIASVLTLRIAYLSNYEFKFRELGYITQVHTTHDSLNLVRNIRKEILEAPENLKPSVLVTGDAVWPFTWYFRDLTTYKFSATDEEKKSFDYIFEDEKNPAIEGFKKSNLKLRGWWVPDFKEMTFRRFLNMSFNLRPWGGYGYSNVNFLEKNG